MNTLNTMEGVSVKRYKNDVKCKLGENDKQQVEEINKFLQEFKKQYTNADNKKEFFRVNNIPCNDSVLYNLKLIFDMFDWQEITIESINKVAKLHKKKSENLLKSLQRRIKDFQINKSVGVIHE